MMGGFISEARLFLYIKEYFEKLGLEDVELKSYLLDNAEVIFVLYDTIYARGEKARRMLQFKKGAFARLVQDILGSETYLEIFSDGDDVNYRLSFKAENKNSYNRVRKRGRKK